MMMVMKVMIVMMMMPRGMTPMGAREPRRPINLIRRLRTLMIMTRVVVKARIEILSQLRRERCRGM